MHRPWALFRETTVSTNSCVDRLNTEGGKDPASRLTQTSEKRREQAMQAETNEQKQDSKVEKAEGRDKSRRSTQTANRRDEFPSA